MRTRLIVGAAVLAAVVALAGCGVRPPSGASTAAPDDVPYGLLEVDPGASTTTLPELAARDTSIWLVADDAVVPVPRQVAVQTQLEGLVRVLVEGPTAGESALGLRTAIAADDVVDASVTAGVARIDLAEDFASAPGREQLLALAQLVYTATELDTVEVVSFALDGEPVDVPRGDGTSSNGPVTRRDYASVAHRG